MNTREVADAIVHANQADDIFKKLGDKISRKAIKSWRSSKRSEISRV